jgi:hypothetical protein
VHLKPHRVLWPRMGFFPGHGRARQTGKARRWGPNPARRRARAGGALLAAAVLLVSNAQAAAAEAPSGNGGMDARLDLLFGEHAPYRTFLQALQAAVAADDRKQVAGMVSYPLKTSIHGRAVRIRTQKQFLHNYEELLPPATRAALAAQAYGALFVNSQGVMIGSGQVWFSGVCSDELCSRRTIKVIALNPPG